MRQLGLGRHRRPCVLRPRPSATRSKGLGGEDHLGEAHYALVEPPLLDEECNGDVGSATRPNSQRHVLREFVHQLRRRVEQQHHMAGFDR